MLQMIQIVPGSRALPSRIAFLPTLLLSPCPSRRLPVPTKSSGFHEPGFSIGMCTGPLLKRRSSGGKGISESQVEVPGETHRFSWFETRHCEPINWTRHALLTYFHLINVLTSEGA